MCDVDGFLILHSGRPVPGSDEKVERNEGVVEVHIMLDSSMGSCWKNCGKVWNPVSSHIVSAGLKLSDQIMAASARRRSQPLYASVISVYAPLMGQVMKIKTSSLMIYRVSWMALVLMICG